MVCVAEQLVCRKFRNHHHYHQQQLHLSVYCTSFQIRRGPDILKVVHVDDIDDGRNNPGLVLQGRTQNTLAIQKSSSLINMFI